MNKLHLILAVIAASVLSATAASALNIDSIPGPDGEITACYRATGIGQGILNVIDSAATCPTGYETVAWASGLSGYEVVVDEDVSASSRYTVDCPTGKVATGGGVSWGGYGIVGAGNGMIESFPAAGGAGWVIWYATPAGAYTTVDAYAICVNA